MPDHCPVHLCERRKDSTCEQCEKQHDNARRTSIGGDRGGARGCTTLDHYDGTHDG